MGMKDQLQAFFAPPRGMRKVVVSTNVAEASVTIDGIVYVVDAGFSKIDYMKDGVQHLVISPISQSAANQRAGPARRTDAPASRAGF